MHYNSNYIDFSILSNNELQYLLTTAYDWVIVNYISMNMIDKLVVLIGWIFIDFDEK